MRPFELPREFAIGRAAEAFLLGAHPELRWPAEGERRWDLEGAYADGRRRTIEVKCDTHPMLATPSYFMEARTNLRRTKESLVGGPWRARNHSVNEFVYLFSNSGSAAEPGEPVAFWFDDVPALVKRLDEGILDGEWEIRRNRALDVSYFGYLVPRAKLAHLAQEVRYGKEG